MSWGTILTIALVLLLIGVIPAWLHSTGWGYGPSVGPVGWFLSPEPIPVRRADVSINR